MNVCSPLIFLGVRGFYFIILFYFLFLSSGKSDLDTVLPSLHQCPLSGMVCRFARSVFPLLHPPSLADRKRRLSLCPLRPNMIRIRFCQDSSSCCRRLPNAAQKFRPFPVILFGANYFVYFVGYYPTSS